LEGQFKPFAAEALLDCETEAAEAPLPHRHPKPRNEGVISPAGTLPQLLELKDLTPNIEIFGF
jgi:hypothetical protein